MIDFKRKKDYPRVGSPYAQDTTAMIPVCSLTGRICQTVFPLLIRNCLSSGLKPDSFDHPRPSDTESRCPHMHPHGRLRISRRSAPVAFPHAIAKGYNKGIIMVLHGKLGNDVLIDAKGKRDLPRTVRPDHALNKAEASADKKRK